MPVAVAERVTLEAVPGLPVVRAGDDLPALVAGAIADAGAGVGRGDVVVVSSKVVSRAEGRFASLAEVTASPRANDLAARTGKDRRLVELILRESTAVSRAAPGVVIARHKTGVVLANAGIDASNAEPGAEPGAEPADAPAGRGPWVVLLPEDPDASAERLRRALPTGAGVVISDSLGRPFRLGTVGAAIGVAGVPALVDRRGDTDLFGRALEHTSIALADQIAAAADMVAGQADEGRAVVIVRGLQWEPGAHTARELVRPVEEDLYA